MVIKLADPGFTTHDTATLQLTTERRPLLRQGVENFATFEGHGGDRWHRNPVQVHRATVGAATMGT